MVLLQRKGCPELPDWVNGASGQLARILRSSCTHTSDKLSEGSVQATEWLPDIFVIVWRIIWPFVQNVVPLYP